VEEGAAIWLARKSVISQPANNQHLLFLLSGLAAIIMSKWSDSHSSKKYSGANDSFEKNLNLQP
jgi:hypothetical protein